MRLIFLTFCLLISTNTISAGRTIDIPAPPASLAQWYPPVAKRLVWLHNMFKLRRELQAVAEYARLKDQPRMNKWARQFDMHYRKIGEMVPEWKSELDMDGAQRLASATASGDFSAARQAVRKLNQSCRGCHRDYRAIVTLLYRTPDFSKQTINAGPDGKTRYKKHMEMLATEINRIKIAMVDERPKAALNAFNMLSTGINQLAESCANCHKQTRIGKNYFDADLQAMLKKLGSAIQSGDQRQSGMALGEVAVSACSHCHGTHRVLYDLKQLTK